MLIPTNNNGYRNSIFALPAKYLIIQFVFSFPLERNIVCRYVNK